MTDIEFWYWFVLAMVLVSLELFVPGAFFLGLSVAAGVAGVVAWVAPDLSWQNQLLFFAVLSFLSVPVFRRFVGARAGESEQPLLNQRGRQYVGRTFTLEEPVVNGQGKIRVDDSTWKISGADCEAGTRVVVSGVNGVVLEVEDADR